MSGADGHPGGNPATAATRQMILAVAMLAALVLLVVAGCTIPGPVQERLDGWSTPTLAPVTSVPAALTADTLAARAGQGPPVRLRLEVLATSPHDPATFTQGLEFGPDGRVFETSGLYDASWVGVVDPASGTPSSRMPLPGDWFAEGLTLVDTANGPELIVLTWREGTASFRDPVTLAERRQVTYDGEGWGVCDLGDGTVAMSNGTATLTIRSADDFAVVRTVPVTSGGRAVSRLNELECRGGLVWANVWMTGTVVAIDPGTGRVVGELDASALVEPNRAAGGDVLNGIAAVPTSPDEFLLTGKRWPTTYRVRITAA